MYEFVRGPLALIAFIVFFAGSIYRIAYMLKGVRKDKIVFPHMSWKHSLASLVHWLIPFNNQYMRRRPIFTVVTFAFHICLVIGPLLLLGHVMLIEESWNISWWTLSETLVDWMTVVVIAGAGFFLYRRLSDPVVKNVTDSSDYILLAITVLPFITGFVAYHQLFAYKTMLIIHILAGEVMLVAIPFTRLSHMLFFAFTRTYYGSESGFVRHSKDW